MHKSRLAALLTLMLMLIVRELSGDTITATSALPPSTGR
jgi:hypothetical protein